MFMVDDKIILLTLLLFLLVFLIWGRWRYDLVAFGALVLALVTGVVPSDQAFSGFGHPATVVIALVLVVSRGLSNSGAVELVARLVVDGSRRLGSHIAIMSSVSAALSAVMNNVAALALLMPLDMEAAHKAKRSPSLTLMPLSFASILGGMITLIGTPPNIVIAEYRGDALGDSYNMFDFTPVGLVCAVIGVVFVTTVGWRLIPAARREHDTAEELMNLEGYVAEVSVPEGAPIIGKEVRDLDDAAEDNDAAVVGVVRRGKRLPGFSRGVEIRKGDVLVVEASPAAIDKVVGLWGLQYARGKRDQSALTGEDLSMLEAVVPAGARIAGRSALSLRLLYRHGVTLLGVSRQGRKINDRVRKMEIKDGDILLLLGPSERLQQVVSWLGCLTLADRGLQVVKRRKALLAAGIFAVAVALASTGVLYLPVALACAAVLMVLLGYCPHPSDLRGGGVAGDRAAGIDDSDRGGAGAERGHRLAGPGIRGCGGRSSAGPDPGDADDHHHDPVRRHE